ncbi:penicillin-binding transpeptidase domain-containing protein [Klebsiella pneumoniae]|uniref:penicillin-binding transpeptidase domain-containing protein n=1 Tax=Klebsiella pneumoniae TaxID=573 RepID=UPI002B400307|nr:penicillin-binding transpeptidase domain-containing protein [Klebsiella pneumoniae]
MVFEFRPREQISFLRKLYHNKLHVSERSQRIVKQAMLTEANGDYIIRAKTGYSTRIEPKIGWWVGWLNLMIMCGFLR